MSFELWARHFLDGHARPERTVAAASVTAPLVVGPAAPVAVGCA
jgi:hypothetical protein